MIKVGITGGIGSGKTTICDIFAILGIPVYQADQRAHWLMNTNLVIINKIKAYFGNESYNENGHLDRGYLSEQVFDNQERLQKLNEIVHPAVGEDYQDWCKDNEHLPYTLKEAAIMYESGSNEHLDKVITVWAPKELRIRRIKERNKMTREEVLERMQNQWPELEKLIRADYVILNDGQHSIIKQVYFIHRLISTKEQ